MKAQFTPKFNRLILVAAMLAAMLGSVLNFTPVHAASIIVNSNADTDANDGACTLREAILATNNTIPRHPAPGECAAGSLGADSISFSGNYTITVGSQLPVVTTPIAINGRGATNTIIQAHPNRRVATWRIFQVASMGNLTLDKVTVRNGQCHTSCRVIGDIDPNYGGGIYNSGSLTVMNSTIAGNAADYDGKGGGIYNRGTLTVTNTNFSGNFGGDGGGAAIHNKDGTATVTNSTIIENFASGIYNAPAGTLIVTYSKFSGNFGYDWGGGGIFNAGIGTVTDSIFIDNKEDAGGGGAISNWGTLTLTDSTLAMNEASNGGGIYNYVSGNLTVRNSTLSANTVYEGAGTGGGIVNNGILTINNSTISGNVSDNIGGIYNRDGSTAILRGTIVANNIGGNCSGVIINNGNNLDSGTTCGFGFNVGSLSETDPRLGPLADNGGPTQTMALLSNSPAIDQGSFCRIATIDTVDQRGVSRPQGAGCDIGAYEYNGTFWDVNLGHWAWDFIERLYDAGVTSGCGASPMMYCPATTVTRDQMAVFLLRGKHGNTYAPTAATGVFGDVPIGHWAAAWIERLATEGITSGCGSGNYCPNLPVTRDQMAVFLLKARHGSDYAPPQATGVFDDVDPEYWAADWIEQLAEEGITSGCSASPMMYCPGTPVTRGQMAVFLVRAFSLP